MPFMFYLQAFVDLFRFIKRYRERQTTLREHASSERAAERQHQLALAELILNKLVEHSKSSNEGLLELAKAQAAQAEVMSTWLRGFQTDPTPEPPSVYRDEDAYDEEQKRELVKQLPPEFRLAFALDNSLESLNQSNLEAQGFDREGSDF